MLSQLNLRFHKKLIEALKTRAGRENTSVNALAERFLDDGLKTVAPGDGYFQLIADPEATVRQLYRHIILGQTFGTSALSRDELRFVLVHVREAFLRGHNRLATLPAPGHAAGHHWQPAGLAGGARSPCGRSLPEGGFSALAGKNWTEEFEAFRAALRPVVDQMYAEHLLRPLESDCFGSGGGAGRGAGRNLHPAAAESCFPVDAARPGLEHRTGKNAGTGAAPGYFCRHGNH